MLSFQCMLNSLEVASSYEVKSHSKKSGWSLIKTRASKRRHLKRILKYTWDEKDTRIYTLAWLESRLRPTKRGDRGKACGIFQIHARHSYPLFHRKKGYVGYKEEESKKQIESECRKLSSTKYSIETVKKLLKFMDEKDLHVCHHNSGLYGKCNSWYKKRADFWMSYFELSKFVCDRERLKKWLW